MFLGRTTDETEAGDAATIMAVRPSKVFASVVGTIARAADAVIAAAFFFAIVTATRRTKQRSDLLN